MGCWGLEELSENWAFLKGLHQCSVNLFARCTWGFAVGLGQSGTLYLLAANLGCWWV